MTPPLLANKFRPDIDGLRALAVLGVVLYHAGLPFLPGGFAGVDVFFVISGFLITGLLVDELDRTGQVSLADFYARRARRILPALLVVIWSTLLLGSVTLLATEDMTGLLASAAAATAFVANEYFRLFSGGYFDGPAEWMPLLHLWSLAVEEQFYIFWPLLLLIMQRIRPGAGRWPLVLVFILAGFVVSNIMLIASHELAFYSLASRAWELATGAAVAIGIRRGLWRPSAASASVCSLIGLAMIVASYVLLEKASFFPGAGALLPVLGTALVILGNAEMMPRWVGLLLANRIMLRIGLASFSWYLWHWPLLALARSFRQGAPNLMQDIALVFVALLLALLTLRFIETPFRHRKTTTPTVLKVALASLLLTFTGSLVLKAWLETRPPNATLAAVIRIKHDKTPYRDNCHLSSEVFDGKLPVAKCRQGGSEHPAVLVWGDSHANAWAPVLDTSLGQDGRGFLVLTMSACPPIVGVTPRITGVGLHTHCREFNDAMLAQVRLQVAQGLKGVLLAARWPKYDGSLRLTLRDRGPDYLDQNDASIEDSLSSLKQHLAAELDALTRLGLRVGIMLIAPEFPEEIRRCLMHHTPARCGVSRAAFDAYRLPVNTAIREAAAGRDNVRIWDPASFFCGPKTCPPFVEGHPASYDDNHVSASAARAYGARLVHDINWLSGRDLQGDHNEKMQ